MGIRTAFSPMSHLNSDDAYLVHQIFGKHTSIQNYQPGYYCGLFSGSGGNKRTNAWGNNASGGSGAVLDCIFFIPQPMKLEISCHAYNAPGKFTYIRDISGLTDEEIAHQEESVKKYIIQVGCGNNAGDEWSPGAGGKLGIIDPYYVKKIRDSKNGINGKRGDGGSGYLDGPWGKIGCANWSPTTEKSLIRKGKQGLASDGYLELWFIGNLSQNKLAYIPLIAEVGSQQDFYPSSFFSKSELGG